MRAFILVFIFFLPMSVFSQSISAQTVKKYAKLAIQKVYGKEYVQNISIEIIEWDYDYGNDRFDITYQAAYEPWLIAYWGSANDKCQLKCDFNGRNAKFKFHGMFENWKNWSTVYEDPN